MADRNICASVILIFFIVYCKSVELHTAVAVKERHDLNWGMNGSCKITGTTLVCTHIPESVPQNITNVIITNMDKNLTDHQFADVSWKHVEYLELVGDTAYTFKDYQMSGLSRLRKLVFILYIIHATSNFSFAGLTHLRSLSFIDSKHQINPHILEPGICTDGMLPNLEELIINPGIKSHRPIFDPSDFFINQLLYKPLKLVNISNTVIIGSKVDGLKMVLKLEVINITNSVLIQTQHNKLSELSGKVAKPLLKTLDVSGYSNAYKSVSGIRLTYNPDPMVLQIENIYADKLQMVHSGTVNYSFHNSDTMLTRTIYARTNKIALIYINCTSDRNHTIETIDLSNNEIQYMQVYQSGVHLLKFFLSRNKLYLMEKEPEFEHIFSSSESLRYLDLAENNISTIPFNMFHHLSHLYHLNLAGNKLQTISFSLKTLVLLEYLDLRNNFIRTINGHYLSELQSYIDERTLRPVNNFELNLHGNPLECSCESADFIKWFVQFVKNEKSLVIYRCVYKGSDIYINSDAADKSRYLCKVKLIIICSVIASVATISLFVVGIFFIRLRKRKSLQKNKVEEFLDHFLSNQTEERFLIFLSMANMDEEFVNCHLVDNMKQYLSTRLETDDVSQLISTGNHFRPGFPIVNEAHRFIKDSCVFVAVLSEAFCASEYCRGEVQEACSQYKPIILILLGNIDESKMSSYMMDVFKRKSRAKFVRNENDEIELEPSIQDLSESIILLAADKA